MSPFINRLAGTILLLFGCAGQVAADTAFQEPLLCEKHSYANLSTGYRYISLDGATELANPYGVNRSGLTAAFDAAMMGHDLKLRADGRFLHPDDYQSELFLDYGGIIRADLEGRSLHHNLTRNALPESFAVPNPAAPNWINYSTNPSPIDTELGITSRQGRADLRIRFGHFPGHLSLGYWRFAQTGHDQLVTSDYEWTPTNTSATHTFYDVTRRIDQVTHEGRIGLDANLGLFSLAYNFQVRDFSNDAPAVTVAAFPVAVAVPTESRVTAHSIKLFSNLSGGLTAAAVYSITQRENTSQRSDLSLTSRPRDTIQQLSGDLSYTPFKEVTVALKYRHREIDRETPATVTTGYSGSTTVRPSTSSTRDTILLTSSWRPDQRITLRGEYRADLLSRNNVATPLSFSSPQAVYDDSQQLHSGTISLLWRPWRTTRLNSSYSYTTNNRPGTLYDFTDRHNGSLLIDWSSAGNWGTTLHYRATADRNQQTSSKAWYPNQTSSLVTPRDSLNQSAGASVWFSPLPRLVVTASYGCMATDAEQAMLLTPTASSYLTTHYASLGHVYGLDSVYNFNDRLDISASLQQVRSSASFRMPSQSYDIGADNRLDTTESSASVRLDWRLNRHFGWMLDYRISAYRSDDTHHNGDIHSTTVSLTARW